MKSASIKALCKDINKNLHDLDRVLNGFIKDMPCYPFREKFLLLIVEISHKKNLTRRNINILGEYFCMKDSLEMAFQQWDVENYEKNPCYEKIDSMYVEIYNTLNTDILKFLQIYDAENMQIIRLDEEHPVSITPHIQAVEAQSAHWSKPIFEAINLKPGVAGISLDIKKLFNRK
ncbi:MAG: hypothetical protein KZQ93_06765 [Candidatus Thiodiazotropha sp. (ex Monitilora ramsayi)]|nr:hypothetical protein [Candidatus Thiodiazotropha sp. (ex Monitilora ramsayi)]